MGVVWTFFFLVYLFSFLSPSLLQRLRNYIVFLLKEKVVSASVKLGISSIFGDYFQLKIGKIHLFFFFFLIGKGVDYWPQIGPWKIPEYVWFITSRLDKK